MRDFFVPRDRAGHFRFDLAGYVAERLARRAWPGPTIWRSAPIRRENGFFSFRRTTHRGETDYGREIRR